MTNSFLLNSYLFVSKYSFGFAKGISLYRKKRGLEDVLRVIERLGKPSSDKPTGKLIWLHAASIGESLLALSLIERFCIIYPEWNFILTTNTVTSGRVLSSKLPQNVIHQYLPYDFLSGIKRFLDHWKPSIVLIIESEFWPALITEVDRRKIPLLSINSRLSNKSFNRWKKYPKLTQALLNKFDLLLVQSQEVLTKYAELGVLENKLVVTGQIKQESKPLSFNEEQLEELKYYFRNRLIWVAASTHEGEEEVIVRAHKHLLKRLDEDILLIITPRYPDRGNQIEKLVNTLGFSSVLRSEGNLPEAKDQVYIADTMGELGLWYRLARVCFVGGSLIQSGGHNPYEPAQLGCPIIHGKHIENFIEPYNRLAEIEGAQVVSTLEELSNAVEKALDPKFNSFYALKGKMLDQANGEPINKTLEIVESYLSKVS